MTHSSLHRVGIVALGSAVIVSALGGCVRRTMTITSEPPGALVMLNDREVGRTPVEVEFLWYGDYDVRLSLDGHDPLVTKGKVRSPLWDTIPLDIFAEMSPGKHEVRRALHFELTPSVVDDTALVERARRMRSDVRALPLPDADGAGDVDGHLDGDVSGDVAGDAAGEAPSAGASESTEE